MLWESDRKEEAIKVAEKVVKAKPPSFTNQKLIGEYYAQRDPVKTAAAFEAYLAHRPAELEGGDVLPRIRLGFAYLANARSVLGDGDEARAQAALHEGSRPVRVRLAQARQEAERDGQRGERPVRRVRRPRPLGPSDQRLRARDPGSEADRCDGLGVVQPRHAPTSRASRRRRRAPPATSSRACARTKRAASC